MHSDHLPYYMKTTRSRMDKSINSLLGLFEGVAIDGRVNQAEIDFLNLWLAEYRDVQARHPFNELVPVIETVIGTGLLSEDERQDVKWLCENLTSVKYFNVITADLQRLHAILGGIISDGIISEDELNALSEWLGEHEHLRSCWPYDEVDSLITSVMADQRIDAQEHKMLLNFFSEFILTLDDNTITNPLSEEQRTLVGICAACPDIAFEGSTFCFTGASSKYTRSGFNSIVEQLGGMSAKHVSKKVNYLVIGAEGNPCWAYACYGRKVEEAVKLRKEGVTLLIVHEHDFHDAVADL
ncbi:BRCT domain-containing protein [Shewanella xiamenensis]|uniref:BRCT domain-containing protein n=1 Tax=Shewanella xiamenensis TaxID=332186 RepID=UPI0021BF0E22|nr:BRCT domain-containing protein [Shewanella xiamenensis]MCT8866281.1 BRCT domain-containing protein [Shewanella xiamenensis]